MSRASSTQAILIVDDSDDDFDVTLRALNKGEALKNPIFRCEDGEEALDYLFQRGRYAEPGTAPRPEIILLDLNMPGIDGRQVLREIKADDSLRSIPVLVMTNSNDERDIKDCYKTGASTFIQKPLDWPAFMAAMQRLREYWMEIAILARD